MIVGELTAAHVGQTFTISAESTPDGAPVTGPLRRVQHIEATDSPIGDRLPPQTWVVLNGWSGALETDHPIELTEA